jgi:hypothetical protein
MQRNLQELISIFVRSINGLITIGFFVLLYKIYKKTKKKFYLFWAFGFLFYGANIISRIGLDPQYGMIIPLLLFLIGSVFILAGIGELINRTKEMVISTLILPMAMIVLTLTSGPEALGWGIMILPYLLISMSLLMIRVNYPSSLDLLILGWINLLLVNVAYALNLMDSTYVDIMAIFGKIVIYRGMTDPRFSLLADDLKRYLISGYPTVYSESGPGSFNLVGNGSNQKTKEIKWIIDKVRDNSLKGIRTILITTYDLITPQDLRTSGLDESLYVVRMLQGGRGALNMFEEHIMTINDDLDQLRILFSDIINYSNEKKINCEIIMFTLSNLIHTHGWKRVYTFIISQITELKSSKVQVYGFYYPETHENSADVTKFEKLSDKIITI